MSAELYIKFGGKNWLASLTFEQASSLALEIKTISDITFNYPNNNRSVAAEVEYQEAFITLIHTSLQNNYPNLTRTQFMETIEISNSPKSGSRSP